MRALNPYSAFREAVLDLAEEPTPVNARRYLRASASLARRDGAPAGAASSPRSSSKAPIVIEPEPQPNRIALRNDAEAA